MTRETCEEDARADLLFYWEIGKLSNGESGGKKREWSVGSGQWAGGKKQKKVSSSKFRVSSKTKSKTPDAERIAGMKSRLRKGEIAEALFVAKALSLGMNVSKPFGQNCRYDFMVETMGRAVRVQVKSTWMDRRDCQDRRDRRDRKESRQQYQVPGTKYQAP